VPNQDLWRLAKDVDADELLCDSAMPLMIHALTASGEVVSRPAPKGAGSLLAGIRKLQSCKIVIRPECPSTYEEFKGLRWSVDPKTQKVRRPLVTVGEDHTVAASRYALSEIELTEMQSDGVD
jgi:phage terminase large subunit